MKLLAILFASDAALAIKLSAFLTEKQEAIADQIAWMAIAWA